MSGRSPPSPASQADALVSEIREQVALERRRLLDDAEREADEIRGRARDKARRQMRRAVEEMRESGHRRLAQVRAELETALRHDDSVRSLEVLATAWPLLRAALARRWDDDDAAAATWMRAQLADARARLGPRGWLVRHPASASAARIAALRDALVSQGAIEPSLKADPGLDAGLVVEVGGARLDATPDALLAIRPAVEAALLAEVARAAGRDAADE